VDPALVAQRVHQVSTADGIPLHVCDYLLPVSAAWGSIVLMHGLGEHSGRHRHLAQFLNAQGLSVRTYDMRGHGRSGGTRGDVIHGDPMLQDAEIVIDEFAAGFDAPPFLLGHSMGGLFAARFALSKRSPLRGLILSSPALAVNLSAVEQFFLKVMHRVAPWLGVPNGLQPRYLSHDTRIVDAYRNDPLVHNRISARLLQSMLASIDYCAAHAQHYPVPALLLYAGDDHLVDAGGSESIRHAPNVEAHRYDALYHEIFNEGPAAFSDLGDWLARQRSAPAV
jgi:alpha-beta hydrolase superfamily lysophospholipase